MTNPSSMSAWQRIRSWRQTGWRWCGARWHAVVRLPWVRIAPWAGAAALVVAVAHAMYICWSKQPASWRQTNGRRLADSAATWWFPALLMLGGAIVLTASYRHRNAVRRAPVATSTPAAAGDAKSTDHWPSTILAVAAAVTVLVTTAAVFLTNQFDREQAHLTEQGQITDRHIRAIGLLGQEDTVGHSALTTRLGGIYALERLMHDSPDDEPVIIEELCAFVRTHATAAAGSAGVPPRSVPASPLDVQAAVTVLGRRPTPDADRNLRLDLSSTRLSMPKAQLTGAHLSGVYLAGADLTDASLVGAHLNGGANLINADLTAAHLDGANLDAAMLKAAHLNVANLTNADLTNADLTNAYLNGAHLTRANLTGANLTGAHLTRANLTDANLDRADLTGADLSTSRALTSGQVRCAQVDASTKLPAGVARPIRGAPQQDPACRPK